MKIIRRVGSAISQSVDFLVEKNRQAAHLNRLKAVIICEKKALQNAYAALGQQYMAVLEGRKTQESETAALTEEINAAKLRLKKARARYEYTLRYGVPKKGIRVEEVIDIDEVDENGAKKDPDEQDITIAYADPDAVCDDEAIDEAIEETIEETSAKKNNQE